LVDFARRKAVKADPRYRRCLSSTCTGGQIHRKTTNPVVNCKMCGSLSYHMAWHAGFSCDRFNDSHPQAKSLRTSEERLKSIAKKVPWQRMWGLHREGRRVQQHVLQSMRACL
ncbi:hypothetical protein XPA_003341, partial [Xanthoria parietina]